MIYPGKKFNKKHIPGIEMLYTVSGKSELTKSICMSLDKTLKERVKELKIDNAIVCKEKNCLRFWIGSRQETPNPYYHMRNNGDFATNFYIVQHGEIKGCEKLCDICKDKMKGIVDECTGLGWNKKIVKACIFNLTIPEMSADLSSMTRVSNGLLSKERPFRQNLTYEELSFDLVTIKRNVEKFQSRYNVAELKRKKKDNYCSKCVFQCEDRLLTTDTVKTHCCLTYRQAIASGFFKNLKIHHSTSVYREGAYINQGTKDNPVYDKITGCNSEIIQKVSQYNKETA